MCDPLLLHSERSTVGQPWVQRGIKSPKTRTAWTLRRQLQRRQRARNDVRRGVPSQWLGCQKKSKRRVNGVLWCFRWSVACLAPWVVWLGLFSLFGLFGGLLGDWLGMLRPKRCHSWRSWLMPQRSVEISSGTSLVFNVSFLRFLGLFSVQCLQCVFYYVLLVCWQPSGFILVFSFFFGGGGDVCLIT